LTIKAHKGAAAREPVFLTAAESRVLALLPTHYTVEAIAERLGRNRSTVKTHIAHIYKKLGAGCRGEAVTRARETGLLPDPSDPLDVRTLTDKTTRRK